MTQSNTPTHIGWVQPVLKWASRLTAGVLIVAALGKAADPASMVQGLSRVAAAPQAVLWIVGALLVISEVVTGWLLVTEKRPRYGPLAAIFLSSGFLVVTLSLLWSGKPETCSCFGVFLALPPRLTLAIDATILMTSVGQLLIAHDFPSPQNRTWLTTANRQAAAAASIGAAAYLVAALALAEVGFSRLSSAQAGTPEPKKTLYNGDRAPSFRAITTDAPIDSEESDGRWRLLCFVYTWCQPCRDELRDLRPLARLAADRLEIVPVAMGIPMLGEPRKLAAEFKRELKLEFPVAIDPDYAIASAYCDQPIRTPTTVLIDPQGKVRYVHVGRSAPCAPGAVASQLADDVKSMVYNEALRPYPEARERPIYGRVVPDTTVTVRGVSRRLSAFWARKPLLLCFVGKSDVRSKRVADTARELSDRGAKVNYLFVFPSKADEEDRAYQLPNAETVIDASETLRRSMSAWRIPAVYLISEGKVAFESNERSKISSLRRLVLQGAGDAIASSHPDQTSPHLDGRRSGTLGEKGQSR